MSRAIQQYRAAPFHIKSKQPVKVGDLVLQPGDRRRAIVGGWDPDTNHVLVWTVPARAGDVRHLTPWPAETLGIRWQP